MNWLTRALSCLAIPVLAWVAAGCTSPGYNDNPSPQAGNAHIGCPVATEFFSVYFSVRVQPAQTHRDTRLTQEVFRAYCHELPEPGTVYFTADLVGPELPRIPLGLRVVAEDVESEPGQSVSSDHPRVLLDVPPQRYAKGVVELQVDLDRKGRYAVVFTRGGAEALSDEDRLSIPLCVGSDPGRTLGHLVPTALLAIALLAPVGWMAYRYWRRRRAL
ncbi:hypothetical protein [Methylococcus sp. EFPC2]|uniref:hypothetical protein n=1 Tax=Methylococcus sp. EFPC2 TaxID=2812648 RepID=UPI0019672E03|nr:hypothetical protein [Methylococcus sp. EFPC2]QSA97182.1 hypothetical protein JWZ97_18655 [Methylococcus sp. EFPC2]